MAAAAAFPTCTSPPRPFRHPSPLPPPPRSISHAAAAGFHLPIAIPKRRFAMIAKRAAEVCFTLDRGNNDDPADGWCKRRRLWRTDEYVPVRALGEGSFGAVVEARHLETGRAVAVKALRPPAAGCAAAARSSDDAADEVLREAELLAGCRGHPSIVGLHALAIDPATRDVALVMEYVGPSPHDVLYDHRHRGGRPFTEDESRRVMRQLLAGARHMHARRIMHRDIKPGNILVAGGGGGCGEPDSNSMSMSVKICDLGLAAPVDGRASHERAGTRRYMAPEVLLGKPDYDAMVDMWSLGCVMAELLAGAPLFDGSDDAEVLLRIFDVLGTPGPRSWPGFWSLPLAGTVAVPGDGRHRCSRLRQKFPEKVLSKEGFHVLKRLLSCNIDKRPSATAALRSPWFANSDEARASVASAPVGFEKDDRVIIIL